MRPWRGEVFRVIDGQLTLYRVEVDPSVAFFELRVKTAAFR